MFSSISNGYDDLWKAIIRPPRDDYRISDLGPKQMMVQEVRVIRQDLQLVNKQGKKLECSFFEPVDRPCDQLPCVIYLHGNSSSRMESLSCLPYLLPQNISLFCFDFAGCGNSEGEFISLGWYERDDVEVVMDWLRKSDRVSTIGLWGRSMGAVTALMHADRDPSIAGLVLDSPFSSLRTLAEELAKTYSKNTPSFLLSAAIIMIKNTVQSKAKFDINNLNPLDNHVKKAFVPAFFVAGKDDVFINPQHTEKLHQAYAGDKNIKIVDGDHNSRRPQFLMVSIGIFFYQTLQVKALVPELKDIKKESNSNVQPLGDFKDFNISNVMRNIGNDYQVNDAIQGYQGNDDEDEELRLAIEQSLQLSNPQPQQPQQQHSQPPLQQPNNDENLMSFSDDEKK